jgi:hypothetical protein
MTVLSLRWLLARPRRPAAVTRSRPDIVTCRLSLARCPVPPERRTYPDLFFADPVAVEDDSRRMRRGTPTPTIVRLTLTRQIVRATLTL